VRLFVAVNLPAAERRALWDATAPLRELRLPVHWAAEASLHLTLRFLGQVKEERVAAIGAALEQCVRGVKTFAVGFGGVGAFPSLARPRVVWVGVERHPALELLANDVEKALMALGFEPELRPFAPHLTLGRARRGAGGGAFPDLGRLAGQVDHQGTIVVESVDLMQSMLGPGGAAYTVLARAALEAGASGAGERA
jgi:RNA 2',3'-cyclic 3'-phosphodiesterase